jgi:hypothetical protein
MSVSVLNGVLEYMGKEKVAENLKELREQLQESNTKLSKKIVQCIEMPALTNESIPAVY